MKVTRSALVVLLLGQCGQGAAFLPTSHRRRMLVKRYDVAGADIEQSPTDEMTETPTSEGENVRLPSRGKVNEIDFCIAPADVSLSRSYTISAKKSKNTNKNNDINSARESTMSLTRFLNNAANRSVRRILLARAWPSAEALNMSLRQVAAAEKERELEMQAEAKEEPGESAPATSKCPVPRPILNVLTGRQRAVNSETQPEPRRSRTDAEYVADQLTSFKDKYGNVAGYSFAEAYLESILALATTGEESPRVDEVIKSGVYDESYKRVTAVLKSVGAVFEPIPGTNRYTIAQRLVDQDICLALFDKFDMEQTKAAIADQAKKEESKVETKPEQEETEIEEDEEPEEEQEEKLSEEKHTVAAKSKPNRKGKFRVQFWKKDDTETQEESISSDMEEGEDDDEEEDVQGKDDDAKEEDDDVKISQNDLGGILLSSKEPSMTRNLNALSNIVQRTLLFGGDQELLVLYETLIVDLPPFIDRWYPGTGDVLDETQLEGETRPGVQYYNCLIRLLRDCYTNGFTSNLDPPLPLTQSYANSYERLMATLVEMGSGYVKPIVSNVMSMPKPRTPQEELGRFAVWETTFRAKMADVASYPNDLEGAWEVRDEIGGETIGVSTVVLNPEGQVEVAPPMQGLRWRLDPGPTHLDTCTFQVLGDDGTVLQYRGFIDRGARLESRFSGRSITIRGSVMFQMRDGDTVVMGEDYWKDMLPINYKTGTTKFVMIKQNKDNQ